MPKYFICALLSCCCCAAAADFNYAPDGDSLRAGNGENARLLCIDAPELYQRYGKQAQQTLQQYLDDGVTVEKHGTDKYDRHLVLLTDANGDSINLALVRAGRAWVIRRYAATCGLPVHDLYQAENSARQAKRGLWQYATPKPPWQWRKENPRD